MAVESETLGDKIGAVIGEHFGTEDGMAFDADELTDALVGNLAFHLALLPQMKIRPFRKKFCADLASDLSTMIVDASRELDEAGISNAVTATPIHRTAQ